MKCPKCDYLGFETGDRCKNCGYDFSLLTDAALSSSSPDLPLNEPSVAGPNDWLHQLDRGPDLTSPAAFSESSPDPLSGMPMDTVVVPAATTASAPSASAHARPASARVAPSLPLFHRGGDDEDAPLIKLPATPRAPLAVRRTPDAPRLRTVPKPVRRPGAEAAPAQMAADADLALFPEEPADAPIRPERPAAQKRRPTPETWPTSGIGRRVAAALLDHAMLLGIDAIVIYLTVQMAALTLDQWSLLPVVPLLLFLGLVKVSYFSAFTLVGGQTVGKMAARIRVVTLDGMQVDPARAVSRTLGGAVSLGFGFIPVLLTSDRRALHDHVARTRVVEIPSA
jgi:uncharacterized RDD family membrane protein YckC